MALLRPESRGVPDRRFPHMAYYARITVTVVAVLAILAAAWQVRAVLVLVLVAAVLAVGLEPPVRRLEGWGIRRGWAVFLIFLGVIGFIALFAALVVPPLVREATQLADNIPDYIRRLRNQSGFVGDLERRFHISEKLRDLTRDLPSLASRSFGTVLHITASVASAIFNTLTIAILTIYFMASLPRFREDALKVFAVENRERWRPVIDEALQKIGGYVSGNILISIIAGIVTFTFLAAIGVPFPAALAMWVAITDLIPTVGAFLGAIVAVAVAAFSSIGDAVATGIFFLVYQQVENYVIGPRVMKRAVDLSPAAVIVSLLIGGSLAGFAGALLALPIAAAAKVVVRDMMEARQPIEVPAQEALPGAEDLPPPE
jgi:predicted PurR-regulated permease PerM